MDLFTYISMNNPDAVNGVLSAYGYERGRTTTEVEDRLKQFVREKRKVALMEIAEIHPDRELIEESILQSSPVLNFDGSGYNPMLQDLRTATYWNKNAKHRPIAPNFFYNAEGQEQEKQEQPKEDGFRVNLKHLIMLGGFLFVGYAIMKSK
jgi:hypothetical protein